MSKLIMNDGSDYPFDMSGLSPEDQARAVGQFENHLNGDPADWTGAVAVAERFVESCRNPPAPRESEDAETVYSTSNRRSMKKIPLLVTVAVAAAVTLAVIFSPSSKQPSPLDAAIQERASAALELRSATEEEKKASSRLRQANARYEIAWKRELCLIQGNCPKK